MLSIVVVAIICWNERHDVLHGMYSPLVQFRLICRSFWLWFIVFAPMTCPNDVFLRKAVTSVSLNTAPNVLLIFNICQCLLIIPHIFDKNVLCVTKYGVKFFRTVLVLLNRAYLFRLSNFSIWFWIFDVISDQFFYVPFFHKPFDQVD